MVNESVIYSVCMILILFQKNKTGLHKSQSVTVMVINIRRLEI